MIKTIKYIVTSALFRLGKETQGKEYTWLEQVAIDYLGEKAPMDGYVGLKCMYLDLAGTARVAQLPSDCMRVSRIAVKSGNRMWTLTVDNNLRIPEEVFECDSNDDTSDGYASFGGGFGWWNTAYTLGGGRNVNYYRIVNNNGVRLIIFDHTIPDGQLLIEYLSNGANIEGSTMIDVAYAEPFRLYLMSQYVMFKGSREEKQMYQQLLIEHEVAM